MRPNGQRYQGEWHNGKPHGLGMATAADGRKRTGVWENGKFVGETQPSIGQDQKKQKLEEGDTETKYWIRNEESTDLPDELTKPSCDDGEPAKPSCDDNEPKKTSGGNEPKKPSDGSNAALSLIVVVVFVVLAMFSTSGGDSNDLDDLTPQELIQYIREIERLQKRYPSLRE